MTIVPRRLPTACALLLALLAGAWTGGLPAPRTASAGGRERVEVPKQLIRFDDGDSIQISWKEGPEAVRILGIDTPEVMHLEHDLPYAQPFGREAAGFLRGAVAVARRVELLRSGKQDQYGRTLAYLILDKQNYSVLVIEAQLASGPSDRFGDNGLPAEFKACKEAAERAGPVPFEAPWLYRRRMREFSAWMKEQGLYPTAPPAAEQEGKDD